MTDVIYLDKYGHAVDNGKEIHELIDGITDMLAAMTEAERLNWFRKSQYPYPITFDTEIAGTIYSLNTQFDSRASESLEEKAERILLQNLYQL